MNRRSTARQHHMQNVFTFVLLGIFAVMSTLMVLLGAQMYRSTVDKTAANNEVRVLTAYVRSMARSADGADGVTVEKYGDIDALSLWEDIEGERYVTWIYAYDGSLYEQFTDASYDFEPDEGTPICAAQRFEPSIDGGLLTLQMTDGAGDERVVQVALRSAK